LEFLFTTTMLSVTDFVLVSEGREESGFGAFGWAKLRVLREKFLD